MTIEESIKFANFDIAFDKITQNIKKNLYTIKGKYFKHQKLDKETYEKLQNLHLKFKEDFNNILKEYNGNKSK